MRSYVAQDMWEWRHHRTRTWRPTLASRPCADGCQWEPFGDHCLWGCIECGRTHLCRAQLGWRRGQLRWSEADLWFDACPRTDTDLDVDWRCRISQAQDAERAADAADTGSYAEFMDLVTRGPEYDPDAADLDDDEALVQRFGATMADAEAHHDYAMRVGPGGRRRQTSVDALGMAKTAMRAAADARRVSAHQKRAEHMTRIATALEHRLQGLTSPAAPTAGTTVALISPADQARMDLSKRQRDMLDRCFSLRDVTFWETSVFTTDLLARLGPAPTGIAVVLNDHESSARLLFRVEPVPRAYVVAPLSLADLVWQEEQRRVPGNTSVLPPDVVACLNDEAWHLDVFGLLLPMVGEEWAGALALFLQRWVALVAWTSPTRARRDITPALAIMVLHQCDYLTQGIAFLDGMGTNHWVLGPLPDLAACLADAVVLPVKGSALGVSAAAAATVSPSDDVQQPPKKKRKRTPAAAASSTPMSARLYHDSVDEDPFASERTLALASTAATVSRSRHVRPPTVAQRGYIRRGQERVGEVNYTNLNSMGEIMRGALKAPNFTGPWFMDWFHPRR